MWAQGFLFVCTAAALVSFSQSIIPQHAPNIRLLPSPCPELFCYEDVDNRGYWTGNLVLRPDYDLAGIWIRLIFDKEVKGLTVDHDFAVVHEDANKKLVKLQNKNLVAKVDSTEILKINVTYEGSEIPSLMKYLLNARTICPQSNINRFDTFQGDFASKYFLPSLQSNAEIAPQPYKCGIPFATNLYPWQSSLYLNMKNNEKYICEAILISPNYLITAAHCVTFKNESTPIPTAFVRARLGGFSEVSKVEIENLVKDIIVHPGYEAGSLTNDVALLRLIHPVDVTNNFTPICLETSDKLDDQIFITGYEIDENGKIGRLLESNVKKVDCKKCLTESPHLQDVLTYDTFCVSYTSDDKFCVGDSGSGLVSISNEKATLRGIVTMGVMLQNKNSCNDTTNAVVTDVERYISWIKYHIH